METTVSKKMKFDPAELDHANKSFGNTNYDRSAGTARGKTEFDPHAPTKEQLADMEKLLEDSGRVDNLYNLNKN